MFRHFFKKDDFLVFIQATPDYYIYSKHNWLKFAVNRFFIKVSRVKIRILISGLLKMITILKDTTRIVSFSVDLLTEFRFIFNPKITNRFNKQQIIFKTDD